MNTSPESHVTHGVAAMCGALTPFLSGDSGFRFTGAWRNKTQSQHLGRVLKGEERIACSQGRGTLMRSVRSAILRSAHLLGFRTKSMEQQPVPSASRKAAESARTANRALRNHAHRVALVVGNTNGTLIDVRK